MSSRPLLRIPLTKGLPPPIIQPRNANTIVGASNALLEFLNAPPSTSLRNTPRHDKGTVLLTGAGISVASGLADYRGEKGTYTLNKTYRPVYFNEFATSHEARKRYWARSFFGFVNLSKSKPNTTHHAIKDLGDLGVVTSVITQNVDSFHPRAHPSLGTIELHGYLRSVICLTCRNEHSRTEFQDTLHKLNPSWSASLEEAVQSGALDTEDREERRKRGLQTNPDGDVEIPDAPYTTFRYPACPSCLKEKLRLKDGEKANVEVDQDGAWLPSSNAGILKPAVIMFGESIPSVVKQAAEQAVDEASRILVMGSSLATYSAFRLVKRAKENGMPIGVLNLGGIRGEEELYAGIANGNRGQFGVRCSQSAEKLLPGMVEKIRAMGR